MQMILLLCLLLLTTCAKESRYKKTLISPRHITRAQNLSLQGEDWVTVLRGKRPIILSAPHALAVPRKGKPYADQGTGQLAIMLHHLCDVTVIYTSGEPPCNPNNHDDNAYKKILGELIGEINPKLVIDLHRAHHSRPFDVDYGTLYGRSCKKRTLNVLTRFLRQEGLVNFSSNTFSASQNQTVTKWAHYHHAEALQLEINSTWLDLEGDQRAQQRFAQLLQGLAIFLNSSG